VTSPTPVASPRSATRSGEFSRYGRPHAHAGAELTDDVGALCWHELVTPDVERAKSFYGPLFGWKFAADSSGLTTIINVGSHIGTMREPRQRQSVLARSWISYFAVESARGAADRAERNGGQPAVEPADGPLGRTALLADPQGATFAVLELPARDESC
jgi:predicted enzyme related to lactoylglutathione lyase